MSRPGMLKRAALGTGVVLSVGAAALVSVTPVRAEQVANERDIVNLRLGQRVLVDDGSCPTGQIKEVTGAQLSSAGVVRRIVCVPRRGVR
ncbi:MAG: DUF6719 family protein [Xanthobacteraceae bacterium]